MTKIIIKITKMTKIIIKINKMTKIIINKIYNFVKDQNIKYKDQILLKLTNNLLNHNNIIMIKINISKKITNRINKS